MFSSAPDFSALCQKWWHCCDKEDKSTALLLLMQRGEIEARAAALCKLGMSLEHSLGVLREQQHREAEDRPFKSSGARHSEHIGTFPTYVKYSAIQTRVTRHKDNNPVNIRRNGRWGRVPAPLPTPSLASTRCVFESLSRRPALLAARHPFESDQLWKKVKTSWYIAEQWNALKRTTVTVWEVYH